MRTNIIPQYKATMSDSSQPVEINKLNCKVVAEFTLNKIEPFSVGSLKCDDIQELACLSYKQMIEYFYKQEELDGNHIKWGYAWHIDDLKIYDKPKELNEFGVKRAFQSWGYFEELEEV